MEELFGTAHRLGSPVVGMLVLAIALMPSTAVAIEPQPPELPSPETPQVPEPTEDLSAAEAVVAALHRVGEQRYAADDYVGARAAWLDAYGRVPPGPETDPYRVTLLSLITNATLAEYAVTGVPEPLHRTEQLLVGALGPESDPALRTLVDQQLDRLQLLLKAEAEPAPAPSPVLPLPEPPPEDEPSPLHPASTPLLAIGAVTAAGGLAMLGAGLAFGQRAERQVPEDDESQAGRDFIADERRKGYAWIGAGAGTAVIGVALVVSGAVLRARSRRPEGRVSVLVPAGGGAGVMVSGRF